MAVTQDEKERVRDLAQKWVEKIERETSRWEQEVIDKILEPLSDKQREILQQMLGPKLKHTKANFDLTLAQLRRW